MEKIRTKKEMKKIIINLTISFLLMLFLLYNFTQFSSNLSAEYSYIEYQKSFDINTLNISGIIDYKYYDTLDFMPKIKDIENPKLKKLFYVNFVLITLFIISVINFWGYYFEFIYKNLLDRK